MDNFETLLKERKLTKTAFSEMLGIKKQNLNSLLKNPTLETQRRIAQTLNIPLWQLFVNQSELREEGMCCPKCGAKLKLAEI